MTDSQGYTPHQGIMSNLFSQDNECPDGHGRFDTLVPRDEAYQPVPCPECGKPSPACDPAPMGRMAMGGISFERGASDPPRSKRDLVTSSLADGESLKSFRKRRREMWAGERAKAIRAALT